MRRPFYTVCGKKSAAFYAISIMLLEMLYAKYSNMSTAQIVTKKSSLELSPRERQFQLPSCVYHFLKCSFAHCCLPMFV